MPLSTTPELSQATIPSSWYPLSKTLEIEQMEVLTHVMFRRRGVFGLEIRDLGSSFARLAGRCLGPMFLVGRASRLAERTVQQASQVGGMNDQRGRTRVRGGVRVGRMTASKGRSHTQQTREPFQRPQPAVRRLPRVRHRARDCGQ